MGNDGCVKTTWTLTRLAQGMPTRYQV